MGYYLGEMVVGKVGVVGSSGGGCECGVVSDTLDDYD